MDMMSMVTSLLAMKAAGTQSQIAATILKSNADSEKSTMDGVGGNLNISA